MNIVSSPLHSLMLGNFNVEDDGGKVVDDDDEKDEPVCPRGHSSLSGLSGTLPA